MDLETKTAVEGALVAFEAVKSAQSGLKGDFEKLDGEAKGRFEKLAAEITKGAEASQKAELAAKAADDAVKASEAKYAALEEKQKLLETALNRPIAIQPNSEQKAKDIAKTRNELFNKFARSDFGNEQVYFDQYLKKAIPDEAERKAMSVNSDPDGGYLVDPEYGGIMKTYVYESSPLRQLANVITIGSDSIEWILDNDQADAAWVSETQARPETNTPRLAVLNVPAHEIYAQPSVTQKFLDDAKIDVEAWLSGKVAEIFTRKENTAFMAGDGVGKPRGILTFAAGTDITQRQVEQVVSGSSSSFGWQSLISLQFSLKEPYQNNASWLLNRTAMGALLGTAGSDGHPIYTTVVDPNGYIRERINGHPAYFASDMPAMASNALVAAYGDFKQAYLIVDRTAIRVLRDPYTNKPFVKFYTTKRVGGEVINHEAYKLLKVSA